MPNVRKLSPRERQICVRLRIWRETLGISRAELLKGTGASRAISQERLAHVENQRAPLRYDMIFQIAGGATIDVVWLATGQKEATGSQVSLPSPDRIEASPRELFSAVFDRSIAPNLIRSTQPKAFPENSAGMKLATKWIRSQVEEWVTKVPVDKLTEFSNEVCIFARDLSERFERDYDSFLKRGGRLTYDRKTAKTTRKRQPK